MEHQWSLKTPNNVWMFVPSVLLTPSLLWGLSDTWVYLAVNKNSDVTNAWKEGAEKGRRINVYSPSVTLSLSFEPVLNIFPMAYEVRSHMCIVASVVFQTWPSPAPASTPLPRLVPQPERLHLPFRTSNHSPVKHSLKVAWGSLWNPCIRNAPDGYFRTQLGSAKMCVMRQRKLCVS